VALLELLLGDLPAVAGVVVSTSALLLLAFFDLRNIVNVTNERPSANAAAV
jgi:hypothetical protein